MTSEKAVRLFSVGKDKTLVEYDLTTSSIAEGVQLVGEPTQCELGATPTTCMFHPVFPGQREEMLVTVNDEYKFKLWNANSKMCRRTVRGPTYGGAVTKLRGARAQQSRRGKLWGVCRVRNCQSSYRHNEDAVSW